MTMDSSIGPYRIVRLIRSGGQGNVFMGYDSRLQRRVAVKIYTLPGERQARKRVLDEAQMVARIDNPRVVRIHDVIASAGHVALIMEYVPGCDLAELLAVTELGLPSIVAIGSDVAAGIAAARQQRIVHGDLKAANVLVTDTGRIKITDFGIARVSGAGASIQRYAGSLAAVSPEQLRGQALDVRSDLYALGCLLYRMLAGSYPQELGYLPGTAAGMAQLPRLPPALADGSAIPAALTELVAVLLQPEPEQRPANTHRVRQILRDVARSIPQTLEPPLLAESIAVFRQESHEDIPVQVPAELRRQGKSRLPAGPVPGTGHWWARLGRRPAVMLGLSSLLVLAMVLAGTTYPHTRPRLVQVQQPNLLVAPGMVLPAQVSPDWLLNLIIEGAMEGDTLLEFRGDMPRLRATTLDRRKSGEVVADEKLQIGLRCSADVCLFGLTRLQGELSQYQHAVLLSAMPLNQWRDTVYQLGREIYRAESLVTPR